MSTNGMWHLVVIVAIILFFCMIGVPSLIWSSSLTSKFFAVIVGVVIFIGWVMTMRVGRDLEGRLKEERYERQREEWQREESRKQLGEEGEKQKQNKKKGGET